MNVTKATDHSLDIVKGKAKKLMPKLRTLIKEIKNLHNQEYELFDIEERTDIHLLEDIKHELCVLYYDLDFLLAEVDKPYTLKKGEYGRYTLDDQYLDPRFPFEILIRDELAKDPAKEVWVKVYVSEDKSGHQYIEEKPEIILEGLRARGRFTIGLFV